MKIAIVYDYLNQLGGGERMLKVVSDMFPAAPIFTIFYDKKLGILSGKEVKTSFLDFSLARKHHRLFIPIMPNAIGSINLKNKYDLIISIGASFARGIHYSKGVAHLHYCFTPLRYAWETNYVKSKFKSQLFWPVLSYLRKWDYRAGQKPDKIVAVSNFIAGKIKDCYSRQADVLYPPVDANFSYDPSIKKKEYFLAAGRLLHYKKFDLIINAFNELDLPLKIVGSGPEGQRLRKLIKSPKVELIGFVSDQELKRLYNEARALVFPQVEDFGLVAAEAQSCGTPVIAFAGGGALEMVQNEKTGALFKKQDVASLSEAVKKFLNTKFNGSLISQSARKFSKANFQKGLVSHITALQKTT